MKRAYYYSGLCIILTVLISLSCGCKSETQSVLVVLSSEQDVSYSDQKAAAEQWANEKNVSLQVVAPLLSTVSDQQKLLENLIRQQEWDLIVIEPLGDNELSPLLDYAKNQGSTVGVIQGTPNYAVDYAVHPCDYEELGGLVMDVLAARMDQSGSYVSIVPGEAPEIMLQEELACLERQKHHYQQMLAVARIQEGGTVQTAYDTTDRLFQAYEMKGVLFFSAYDGLGISQWQQRTGNSLAAVGVGFPEMLTQELNNGAIDTLFYWNREHLLLASLEVGYRAAGNYPDVITTNIEGYRTLRSTGNGSYVGSDILSIITTE